MSEENVIDATERFREESPEYLTRMNLDITWELIYKIGVALIKRRQLVIECTYDKNPLDPNNH